MDNRFLFDLELLDHFGYSASSKFAIPGDGGERVKLRDNRRQGAHSAFETVRQRAVSRSRRSRQVSLSSTGAR